MKAFAVVAAVVVVVVAIGVALFGGRPLHLSSASTTTGSFTPPTTGAVQACIAPDQPQRRPAGGWIPSEGGALDYDPEGQGPRTSKSPEAVALATRFVADLGHGFTLSYVYEYSENHCGLDFDIDATTRSGALAFLQLIQLRRAADSGSWPLLGNTAQTAPATGIALIATETPDDASVTELAAANAGLTSWVQVRSSTGLDPSGWPTTTEQLPSDKPPVPSPLDVDQVETVILDMLSQAGSSH